MADIQDGPCKYTTMGTYYVYSLYLNDTFTFDTYFTSSQLGGTFEFSYTAQYVTL